MFNLLILQQGVTENILDLERARKNMVAEEEKSLNKTKENLEYYINNLRESLNLHVVCCWIYFQFNL